MRPLGSLKLIQKFYSSNREHLEYFGTVVVVVIIIINLLLKLTPPPPPYLQYKEKVYGFTRQRERKTLLKMFLNLQVNK